MSSIKLSPNASGTGIFSIEAPNSSTNRTLTLPDQTGTVLTNAGPFTANASASAGAVTIDASNRVGVGTGSPSQRFVVANAGTDNIIMAENTTDAVKVFLQADTAYGKCYTLTNHALYFGTNNTERARITSGGYFKASFDGSYENSTGTYHEFTGTTANGYTMRVRCTNASPASHYISDFRFTAASPNNTSAFFIECRDSTAARMEFRSNGGIANYSANNVNLSDRREKTNFAPAGSYLPKICAIPVQTFNYIDQNMEEDSGETLGVVAQDVQAVAPELVMESNWGSAEEPKMRLSIYQTDLQYALMKCIQELNAKVAALEARLASDGPSNGGQA